MSIAVIDGLDTYFEVTGSGPPLLLLSPGGFDASVSKWMTLPLYQRLNLVQRLSAEYTCITFDRREAGQSAGRLERLNWRCYVSQTKGLLDHLGIARCHLLAACVGCSIALAFAVDHGESVESMILYSPAGGPRYRLAQQARFNDHQSYARREGLAAVVDLARSGDTSFAADPRVGPWSTTTRLHEEFAAAYRAYNLDRYLLLVAATSRLLFDRDTVSGAAPEDLMSLDIPALVVPGNDSTHAPSAARYLEECLTGSQYWDRPVSEQTEDSASEQLLTFLRSSPSA